MAMMMNKDKVAYDEVARQRDAKDDDDETMQGANAH